ncbi:MAG: hypothetical protein NDJ90_00380 [Oligoflexia bacterium]|nr:hypothetical protein [Oligoflexia bacterium]
MKKNPALAALAHSLLSRSKSLEQELASNTRSMQESLQLLGSLASVAQQSLRPLTAAAPNAVSAASPGAASAQGLAGTTPQSRATAQTAPSAPRPTPVTAHAEYKPALKDQSVIDALLEFHRSAIERPARPLSSFAPPLVPEVEAKPKQTPSFRKGPGVSYPILRPTKPGQDR